MRSVVTFENQVLRFVARYQIDPQQVNLNYIRVCVVDANYIDVRLIPMVKLRYHPTLPRLLLVDHTNKVLRQGPRISRLEWKFYSFFCHLFVSWSEMNSPHFRKYRSFMSVSKPYPGSSKGQVLPSSSQSFSHQPTEKKWLFWGLLVFAMLMTVVYTLT